MPSLHRPTQRDRTVEFRWVDRGTDRAAGI